MVRLDASTGAGAKTLSSENEFEAEGWRGADKKPKEEATPPLFTNSGREMNGGSNEKESSVSKGSCSRIPTPRETLREDAVSAEEYLNILEEGASVHLDGENRLNRRPPWLDDGLLRKGREFANDYIFGVLSTQLPGLAMSLSFPGGLGPLIFTGNSDTPYKAFRRYLSTASRIASWYTSDVFDERSEAHRNMAAVRFMHSTISKKMNEMDREELKSKCTLEGRGEKIWSTSLDDLKKDFRDMKIDASSCPFARLSAATTKEEVVFLNQRELAIVQFGFVSMVILYPKYFGIHGDTKEGLEGFVHLWRGLGYLLGIKDRYNVCSLRGLEVTRDRCKAVMQHLVKPAFRELTPDWEHMFRCLVVGTNHYVPGVSFGGTMAYLLWVLNIPAPHLRAKMTWKETIIFYVTWFNLGYLTKIPGVVYLQNYLVNKNPQTPKKFSDEWLESKKAIIYDYEKMAASNAGASG